MDNAGVLILTEAEKLFMKFGMKSVTMDDIAKHMGISKKTIYANFKDKNEMVNSLISKMLKDDECRMEESLVGADNAIEEVFYMINCLKEMLSEINPVVFYDLEKYHSSAYKEMMDFHQGHVYKKVKTNLDRGIKENIFRENINTEILATARVKQINWVFESDLVRSGKYSMYDVVKEITLHFLFGICTLSGHVLINTYLNKSLERVDVS